MRIAAPMPPKPISIIAQVAGSGTPPTGVFNPRVRESLSYSKAVTDGSLNASTVPTIRIAENLVIPAKEGEGKSDAPKERPGEL